jgi:predicted Zn-dependent peptidase
LPVLERYFGRIPPGPPAPRVQQIEPPQQGERQVLVNRNSAPQVLIAYHKPVFPHRDDAPLSLLAEIMSRGRTSRLYQELIKKRRVAVSVDSFEAPGAAYPNLLVFDVKPRKPHTNQEVLQGFDAVVDALRSRPVSAEELSIAKRKIAMSYLKELKSSLSLARDLARAQAVYGDWRALTRWYEQMLEVSLADVQRVAEKYLGPETRTVARLEKVGQ